MSNFKGTSDRILKFGIDGKIISSFAKQGQGPRELQIAKSLFVSSGDTISAYSPTKVRIISYKSDGSLVAEFSLDSSLMTIKGIPSGDFLVSQTK